MCAQKGLILAWSGGTVYLERFWLWRLLLLNLSDDHGRLIMNQCLAVRCDVLEGTQKCRNCFMGHFVFLVFEGLLSSLLSSPCSLMRPLQAPKSPPPPHSYLLTPWNHCIRRSEVRRIAVYPLCLRYQCQQRVAHLPPPIPLPTLQ